MIITLHLVLLLIAAVLFAVAAFGWNPPHGNLIAAGLFLLTLGLIF